MLCNGCATDYELLRLARLTPPMIEAAVAEARTFRLPMTVHLGLTDAVTASALGVASIERLSGMLRHFGKSDDPVLRDELVRIWIGFQVGKLTGQRGTDKIKAGQLPGPEMSIGKLALTQNLTALSEWVSRVLGPRVTADTGEWGTYAWAEYILGTPGMRLGGGTDEVMRNIVGERVLGLPKDPGIDTTSPFRELKARARP